MTRGTAVRGLFTAIAIAAGATSASAQVFGTFSWQMQPYCNQVTLTLTSVTGNFTLDGSEDQCGATNRASAVGVGTFNASGNVTLNFTIVTAPGGKPVHVSAVVSPANGNGTWTDSVGNSGTFAFFGATPGLPPRPLPASGLAAAIITNVEIAPGAVTGASVANGSLTSVDLLDAPRAAFADGDQEVALTPADVIVRSVTITAPASGTVIVNASAEWRANSTSTIDLGRCSITTGAVLDFAHLHRLGEEFGASVGTVLYSSFSATRAFNVSAGAFTVNLVCDEFSGDAVIRDSSMTAAYFPG